MSEKLTPTARAALLVLMATGRQISNNEMFEIAHFKLHGKDKNVLNDEGWVKTDESRTPYRHVLTTEGWKRCIEELVAEAPERAGGGPLVGALYAVLHGLDRHRKQTGASLNTIFQVNGTATSSQDTESLIRDAYRALAREPGGWVSLADLRERLRDMPRSELDTTLKAMISRPGVSIIPEADQSSLKERDREAAVRIGGEYKHLIAIEGR
jgi:hypothetical protein